MTFFCLCTWLSWLSFGTVWADSGGGPDSLPNRQSSQSINLLLGTTGPGVFYTRQLGHTKRLMIRAGGQYFSYQKQLDIKTANDSYLQVKPAITISIIQANLKWHPFRQSSFFITGGAGYTWHPDMGFTLSTRSRLNLDGLVLLPEDE